MLFSEWGYSNQASLGEILPPSPDVTPPTTVVATYGPPGTFFTGAGVELGWHWDGTEDEQARLDGFDIEAADATSGTVGTFAPCRAPNQTEGHVVRWAVSTSSAEPLKLGFIVVFRVRARLTEPG